MQVWCPFKLKTHVQRSKHILTVLQNVLQQISFPSRQCQETFNKISLNGTDIVIYSITNIKYKKK